MNLGAFFGSYSLVCLGVAHLAKRVGHVENLAVF